MTRLTKEFIDKVTPPEKGYKVHWDDKLKGFGLRVTAAGKKVFVVMGRVQGEQVGITIGPYGTWTLDNARDGVVGKGPDGRRVVLKAGAKQLLEDMQAGIDPRAERKKKEVSEVTLRKVAEAYVARPGKLKESSKGEIERHVATTFEAWADKPINAITEDDCRKRYHELLTKGLRGKAPAPGQANQAFSVLRALINFAARQYKVVTHNPVAALKDHWVQLQPRTTFIESNKVGAVWNMLTTSRAVAYNRDTLASIDLVMFLMLTGARIGEASALTWDRVNLDEAWWHIPDPKNRNPAWLPLSSQAVELLKTRQRIKGSDFVFTSWGKAGHIKDPRDTMGKVSEAAGSKVTPHDLRRTYTAIGFQNCGVDLFKLELLTNHVPKGVTARHYLETSRLQYLLPEVQRIGDWIEVQGKAAASVAIEETAPA